MRVEGTLQLRQLTASGSDDLQTDAAHLVGRFFTPRDAHRRTTRIAFVGRRIVVADDRVEPRARGQRHEVLEAVALLPREIPRSEEHTSELQSQSNLVCRLLLEKKKKTKK